MSIKRIDCWCGVSKEPGAMHYPGNDPENGPAHVPGPGCPECGGCPDHEPSQCAAETAELIDCNGELGAEDFSAYAATDKRRRKITLSMCKYGRNGEWREFYYMNLDEAKALVTILQNEIQGLENE